MTTPIRVLAEQLADRLFTDFTADDFEKQIAVICDLHGLKIEQCMLRRRLELAWMRFETAEKQSGGVTDTLYLAGVRDALESLGEPHE